MNKSESKYYNTALLMNQALIELLNKKEYDFITVKELCKKAGVNRSTFYLHYDNINDLLCETIENINKKFLSCFDTGDENFVSHLSSYKKDDLILITPKYLQPYLEYIKENKIIYQVSAKHPVLMQSKIKYELLQEKVLSPIYNRFDVKESVKKYYTAYYINGLYAIIDEWIKAGCADETDNVMQAIIECVRPFEKNNENVKN